MPDCSIDIFSVDCPYQLPVTSCIANSAAIDIIVTKFRNTICPPSAAVFTS
jgi:hypothetical protein